MKKGLVQIAEAFVTVVFVWFVLKIVGVTLSLFWTILPLVISAAIVYECLKWLDKKLFKK